MTARLPVTVSSVQTWFYMWAYVKKFSPGSTQVPTSRHLLSPHIVTSMTHTHTYTHTPINRLWSPLAYGLGGNNRLWSPLAYGLGGKKLCRVSVLDSSAGVLQVFGYYDGRLQINWTFDVHLIHIHLNIDDSTRTLCIVRIYVKILSSSPLQAFPLSKLVRNIAGLLFISVDIACRCTERRNF